MYLSKVTNTHAHTHSHQSALIIAINCTNVPLFQFHRSIWMHIKNDIVLGVYIHFWLHCNSFLLPSGTTFTSSPPSRFFLFHLLHSTSPVVVVVTKLGQTWSSIHSVQQAGRRDNLDPFTYFPQWIRVPYTPIHFNFNSTYISTPHPPPLPPDLFT